MEKRAFITSLLTRLKDSNSRNKELENEIEKLNRKILLRDYASVDMVERATGGCEYYTCYQLNKIADELGYRIEKVHDPECGQVNAYHKDVWMACYDININEYDLHN